MKQISRTIQNKAKSKVFLFDTYLTGSKASCMRHGETLTSSEITMFP